jgi:hypothetical protein
MGLEILTKARLTLVEGDAPTETTNPVPTALAA